MNFYKPKEDTFLLCNTIDEFLKKNSNKPLKICEIGIGSGYITQELSKKYPEHNYFASDINKDAISYVESLKLDITLHYGNLFEPFKHEEFDLIFFNTPYLPCEDGEKYDELSDFDKAIYGGKKGYEVILEFLKELYNHLTPKGECFFLFSNLSKENIIKSFLEREHYLIDDVIRESHFFEELIVYHISFSKELSILKEEGIKDVKYYTCGKHSKIFQGNYKNTKCIIKSGKEAFISKEKHFLEKLQNKSYVPKVFFSKNNLIGMEKLEGIHTEEFMKISSKEDILSVFQNILDICYDLDKALIQKFEMTNPYKHIFISKDSSITFIDFERSIFSKSPKNSTQFLQYIRRNIPLLETKGLNFSKDKLYQTSLKYKENRNKLYVKDLLK